MHASAEWSLRFSQKQQGFDLLALLLFVVISLYLFPISGLLISVLSAAAAVILFVLIKTWRRNISAVGYVSEGLSRRWWLEINDHRYNVRWRDGSIRRRECVVLCWSLWPWDRLILRADSFASDEAFRQFRAELYGDI